MNEPTIDQRLAEAARMNELATQALAECRHDLGINQRIESANAREIEKLKRHVAALQLKLRSETDVSRDTRQPHLSRTDNSESTNPEPVYPPPA